MQNSKLWLFHKNNNVLKNYQGPQNFTNFTLVNFGLKVVKISECLGNFLILDDQGKIYSLGVSNQYGILGRGFENSLKNKKQASGHIDKLDQIYFLSNEFIVDIIIQKNHCLALNNHGQVFSWGLGIEGALGYELQDLEACQLTPKKVALLDRVHRIFAGPSNSAFLTSSGLYLVGQNQYQTHTRLSTLCSPRKVEELDYCGEICQEVSFSRLSYNLCLTKTGRVFEMGFHQNFYDENKPFLRPIKPLDPQIIQKIRAGRISVALTVSNTIFLWDCLKPNSFTKVNLNFMGVQNVEEISLTSEEQVLAIAHQNTRFIQVLSYIQINKLINNQGGFENQIPLNQIMGPEDKIQQVEFVSDCPIVLTKNENQEEPLRYELVKNESVYNESVKNEYKVPYFQDMDQSIFDLNKIESIESKSFKYLSSCQSQVLNSPAEMNIIDEKRTQMSMSDMRIENQEQRGTLSMSDDKPDQQFETNDQFQNQKYETNPTTIQPLPQPLPQPQLQPPVIIGKPKCYKSSLLTKISGLRTQKLTARESISPKIRETISPKIEPREIISPKMPPSEKTIKISDLFQKKEKKTWKDEIDEIQNQASLHLEIQKHQRNFRTKQMSKSWEPRKMTMMVKNDDKSSQGSKSKYAKKSWRELKEEMMEQSNFSATNRSGLFQRTFEKSVSPVMPKSVSPCKRKQISPRVPNHDILSKYRALVISSTQQRQDLLSQITNLKSQLAQQPDFDEIQQEHLKQIDTLKDICQSQQLQIQSEIEKRFKIESENRQKDKIIHQLQEQMQLSKIVSNDGQIKRMQEKFNQEKQGLKQENENLKAMIQNLNQVILKNQKFENEQIKLEAFKQNMKSFKEKLKRNPSQQAIVIEKQKPSLQFDFDISHTNKSPIVSQESTSRDYSLKKRKNSEDSGSISEFLTYDHQQRPPYIHSILYGKE